VSRHPSEIQDVIASANFYEPRMARAIYDGYRQLQASLSISKLERMITIRPTLSDVDLDKALDKAATVVKNSIARGMTLGTQKLKKVLHEQA
jgi:hypothetical protein